MASQIALPRSRVRAPSLLLVTGGVLLLVLGIRISGAGAAPTLEVFALIATSIVVEALPFILLGSIVAAAIEVFVPEHAIDRIGRLPRLIQVPAAAMGGMAFPVCECGSVPVARRLISRGVDPAAGIAFMLAAPIINPVVLLSTWIAYRGFGLGAEMVAGRAVLGLIVAMCAAWAIGTDGSNRWVRTLPMHEESPRASKPSGFITHLTAEFVYMTKFVVIGAALAAALQTLVPQSIVGGLADNIIVSSLALMGLAFVLSLCSEADAFVAISFTQFSPSAQLAFLVSGPVLDMKLSFLYGASFGPRFVPRLAVVVVPVTLAGVLWFEVLM